MPRPLNEGNQTEYKLDGCCVAYREGTISVSSDRDAADRLVWTVPDAQAAAEIFRHAAPELSRAIKRLASYARIAMATNRKGAVDDE